MRVLRLARPSHSDSWTKSPRRTRSPSSTSRLDSSAIAATAPRITRHLGRLAPDTVAVARRLGLGKRLSLVVAASMTAAQGEVGVDADECRPAASVIMGVVRRFVPRGGLASASRPLTRPDTFVGPTA